jgi:DNA invertase Pin-like site-specific DNA recombinase
MKGTNPPMNQSTGARIYSYTRFSTPDQELGDSERRQLQDAKAWAERNGYLLDDSLKPDRGLSGYHGVHRRKGHLGEFLAKVARKEVPPGSILLVENIDRLSREGAINTLREIIFKLWDHGIVLQTLRPEESYEPGCDNNPKFLALLIYVQRAFDESQRKSERIRAARDRARLEVQDKKRFMTGRVPAWLEVTWDRSDPQRPKVVSLKPIPEAVETIQLIFDMKLKGHGVRTIEHKLNESAKWTPPLFKRGRRRNSGTWRYSYVKKILQNPAVVGDYQPYSSTTGKRLPTGEVIHGYYPQIIKPEVFHAARAKMTANRGTGGRPSKDKHKNLLRHLAKCAYCGAAMFFIDKGPLPKGGRYLVCDTGNRKIQAGGKPKCQRHNIRYDEVETLLLENCPKLRLDHVLPDPSEQTKRCQSLRLTVQAKQAELADIESQIENLIDQTARTKDGNIRDRYEGRIKKLSEQMSALESEVQATESELQKAEQDHETVLLWQRELNSLRNALKKGEPELRERLAAHLRELIERVEVFAVGHSHSSSDARPQPRRQRGESYRAYVLRTKDAQGDTLAEEIYGNWTEAAPTLHRNKAFTTFLDYLTNQRQSKEARFIRVLFKTGGRVDLVPPGSIGSGFRMDATRGNDDPWRAVEPDVQKLWNDFRKQYGAGVGNCQ